jgi:methyltransferase (TIGR00027 family)
VEADRPSRTAGFVAALRGLGVLLPEAGRLIDDPWGAAWTGVERWRRLGQSSPRLAEWLGRPARSWLLNMQVRTHALDLAVEAFAQGGGRQLLLLGAGLDARALRLKRLGLRVYEVDHPATQARKRPLVGDAAVLVPWDFEREPLRQLPARLAEQGFQRRERACVVWEGVTMYLSEAAIEETFVMLRELLGAGSVLAFTYFALTTFQRPPFRDRWVRGLVARLGEPWRSGWEPASLPAWLKERGFTPRSDEMMASLGARWLPPELVRCLKDDSRHIAIAERT